MVAAETGQMLQTIYRVCDAVEKAGGKPEKIEIPLRELFTFDLQRYFMYLSASDGKVLPVEADYMNELFGESFSVGEYVKRIDENRIYSVNYENDVPLSLKIITTAEQRNENLTDEDGNEFPQLSSLLFDLYRDAGIEFLGCDGDVSEQESKDLGMYLARKKMQLQQMVCEEDE